MVQSPDGDTDFFKIAAEVLKRETLALYTFTICLDYVLWRSRDVIKEKDQYINMVQILPQPGHFWLIRSWLKKFLT